MKLIERFQEELKYPERINDIIQNSKNDLLSRLGEDVNLLNSIELHLITTSFAFTKVLFAILQKNVVDKVKEKNTTSKHYHHSLNETFEILKNLPEDISTKLLLETVKFKNINTIEIILNSLRKSDQKTFVETLGQEDIEYNEFNTALTVFELTQLDYFDLVQTDSFYENPEAYFEHFQEFTHNTLSSSEEATQKQLEISDNEVTDDEHNYCWTEEEKEIGIDQINPCILSLYINVVEAYLSKGEFFSQLERNLLLQLLCSPETEKIYDWVEKNFYGQKKQSPFVNVTPKQYNTIVKYILERANDKPGNRSKQNYNRDNVLRVFIALYELKKYESPKYEDVKSVKELCNWLDDIIQPQPTKFIDQWSKVKEKLLQLLENHDDDEKITTYMNDLKKLGIE